MILHRYQQKCILVFFTFLLFYFFKNEDLEKIWKLFCCVEDILSADTLAVFHVKDNTVGCHSIQKSSNNVGIMKKGSPFIEAKLSRNDGGRFLVSPPEKIKEKAGLFLLTGNITEFIN